MRELDIDDHIVRVYARKQAWIHEIGPKPCEVCGNPKARRHHDDYNEPLQVRWLCYKHHAEWHRNNKVPPITEEALTTAIKYFASDTGLRGRRPRVYSKPYEGSLQEAYDKGELQISIRRVPA